MLLMRWLLIKGNVTKGISEMYRGSPETNNMHEIQIEELLGRPPVNLDQDNLLKYLSGKSVLITGAGGSIGSELARQVALLNPSKLLLVERAEPALFQIDKELRETHASAAILPLMADIGDYARMHDIFSSHLPQVVLHAAAHKHVSLMEINPLEAIKNNVLNTQLLGKLAGKFKAESFVLVSTDKAVKPTSVMGASKRVAELVVQGLAHHYQTAYVSVRFGNVIGSTGSVIPIFREQIRQGGPVQVTHPEMKRYFMTIVEASQLVLQAAAIGDGSEIFILDMGTPVNILKLAEETIRISGFKPYEDIDIIFTGIRPGEKLFEELEMGGENMIQTRYPKIFINKLSMCPSEEIEVALLKLQELVEKGCERALRLFLNELLPEGRVLIPALDQHDVAMSEALLSGSDDCQAQRDLLLVASV